LRVEVLILFYPSRDLISRRIIRTHPCFSRDYNVVSPTAFKMKGHSGVLSDMRQASAFRLREAVGQERAVSFIPEKGDGQWLWHSFFVNRRQPDEWLVMEPACHTLASWRGFIGKLKRHI